MKKLFVIAFVLFSVCVKSNAEYIYGCITMETEYVDNKRCSTNIEFDNKITINEDGTYNIWVKIFNTTYTKGKGKSLSEHIDRRFCLYVYDKGLRRLKSVCVVTYDKNVIESRSNYDLDNQEWHYILPGSTESCYIDNVDLFIEKN